MKNYISLVTSLFLLCQCAGGDIAGPATLSHQAPAINQAQSTPTHFGGIENPAPDWGSCWQYDEAGNPISLEDCLKRRRENAGQQPHTTPTPEVSLESTPSPEPMATPEINDALLEPKTMQECQSRLKSLKKLVAELQGEATEELDAPQGPVIKLPPDFSKCLSRWKDEWESYQYLLGKEPAETAEP